MYNHVYQKKRGPGPHNSLCHAGNRKYFSDLSFSLIGNRKEAFNVSPGQGNRKKFGDILAEKNVTLSWLVNSKKVKPKKIDHLHLVYHFLFSARTSSDARLIP